MVSCDHGRAFSSRYAAIRFFLLVGRVSLLRWNRARCRGGAALFTPRIRLALLFTPLFIVAMVVQSVREAIFCSVFAIAVLWAAQGRTPAAFGARLAMALVVGVGLLVVGMTALRSADLDVSQNAQYMLNHTADGVLDIQNSTAGGHLELVGNGVLFGVTHPFGIGLGGTTSASRFAQGEVATSEIDFSDIFISCGVFVGILYCTLILRLLLVAMNRWRKHREITALLALGVMISQLGHWGHGGLYATSPLLWLLIGSVDRLSSINAAPVAQLPARAPVPRPHRRLTVAH